MVRKYKIGAWAFLIVVFWVGFNSCTGKRKARNLAYKTCSSCHLFPDPSLLPKDIWKENVLPEMGYYMGFGDREEFYRQKAIYDFVEKFSIDALLPPEPSITQDEWQIIQEYYLSEAPDSLILEDSITFARDLELFFDIEEQQGQPAPCATFVSFDPEYRQFYTANKDALVAVSGEDFTPVKSMRVNAPVSWMQRDEEGNFDILTMGEMNPNNLPRGILKKINLLSEGEQQTNIATDLYRPVHFQKADFNNDGRLDYLVCSFGYFLGRLSWFEALPDNTFKEHLLNPFSGSLKTVVKDLNGDGYQDFLVLMGQGNEGVYLYNNLQNGEFSSRSFIRLPPVYGSSDFAVEDFNNDGHPDIAIVCGDNGDISQVPKPYHGVRIFVNDGKWNFKEARFIPINGSTGLRVKDFDLDGDKDIAVISYFSTFDSSPDNGFVFLENKGDMNFKGHVSSKTDVGRWLVMDAAPIDGNSSPDLILGSCISTLRDAKASKQKYWEDKKVSYLTLKSKARP